jgi:hypothetical protein
MHGLRGLDEKLESRADDLLQEKTQYEHLNLPIYSEEDLLDIMKFAEVIGDYSRILAPTKMKFTVKLFRGVL